MSTREYIRGINEPLPEGERVLWQGAPDWRQLAVRAFHVRKVAIYFALILAWRLAAQADLASSWSAALQDGLGLVLLALIAIGLLSLLAWLSARTTIYAITNKRVYLRVGIALPLFVNLPFSGIESAALRVSRDGTGDVPLRLKGGVRLAYLTLWPHVRPWRAGAPEPMLRAVPDANAVAQTLAQSLAAAAGVPTQWSVPRAVPPREPLPEQISNVAA